MNDCRERLLSLIDQSGKQDKQIEIDLGIPRTTISNWRSGKTKSYNKYLYAFSKYFGVSVEYLSGTDDSIKKEAPSDKWELSQEEQTIIEVYRSLNAKEREHFRWLAERLPGEAQTADLSAEQARKRQQIAIEVQKQYSEHLQAQRDLAEDKQG